MNVDYEERIENVEKAIDKTMARYWSAIQNRRAPIVRDYLLRDADKLVRELENYRSKVYNAQASQG